MRFGARGEAVSSFGTKELLEGLDRLGASQADAPAVVALKPGGRSDVTTYGDLLARAGRFARAIERLSPDQQIVPLFLARTADSIAAALGTIYAGKVFAMLNRKFQLPQIDHVLQVSGSAVLVVDGPALLSLRRFLGEASALSQVQWVVLRDPGFSELHEKILAALPGRLRRVVLSLDDPELPEVTRTEVMGTEVTGTEAAGRTAGAGCCLFTSGSTGTPKGVLIGAEDLARRAEAEVQCFRLGQSDVLLSVLPFAFDVGLNQMLSSLTAGARLVILESWLPSDILNATASWSVTGISGVPSLWRSMMNAGLRFDTAEQHRALRYVTVSGGSLSPSHLEKLPEIAPGVGIIKTYGQTEAFRATCLLPQDFDRFPQSVGRPFPGVRLYVLREDGTPCAAGESGEIAHAGLGVMRGYLGGGDAEKLGPDPFLAPEDPAARMVRTGDYGHLNEEGFLFLEGRKDDLLKIAGNRVYPEEIVRQIYAAAEVAEVELVAVEDRLGETRTVAFVVAGDETDQTAESLLRDLAKRLPPYMVPAHLELVPQIPRTESGKTNRPRLAETARSLLEAADQARTP